MSEAPHSPLALPEMDTPPSSGGGARNRVVIWGLVMSLVGVLLLTETGVVRVESTQTKWNSQSQYDTSWHNRRPGVLQAVVPTVTIAGPSGTGKTIANHAAEAIRKSSSSASGGVKLDIVITQLTSTGSHWVPFFKSGSCAFTAEYKLAASAGASSFEVRGKITGDVEQTTKGLCSTSLFREYLGKAVAAAIANEIQGMIRKNG